LEHQQQEAVTDWLTVCSTLPQRRLTMWQILTKRRDLVQHGLGVLLLVVFPQRLPVRPNHSVITQRTS